MAKPNINRCTLQKLKKIVNSSSIFWLASDSGIDANGEVRITYVDGASNASWVNDGAITPFKTYGGVTVYKVKMKCLSANFPMALEGGVPVVIDAEVVVTVTLTVSNYPVNSTNTTGPFNDFVELI